MITNIELTEGQGKQARRMLECASAFPSRTAGVVLGQIHWRRPGKLVLTLVVIGPAKAQRIAKIIKET